MGALLFLPQKRSTLLNSNLIWTQWPKSRSVDVSLLNPILVKATFIWQPPIAICLRCKSPQVLSTTGASCVNILGVKSCQTRVLPLTLTTCFNICICNCETTVGL